jgi:hypothetical protein
MTKPSSGANANNIFKKFLEYVGRDEIRHRIQDDIIDPLLNHIMKRVFPYIILTCVLFILLLLVVLMTLGIVVFQMRTSSIIQEMIN